METTLTDVEANALLDMVITRMRHDLELKCDCPLHRRDKEERSHDVTSTFAKHLNPEFTKEN